MTPMPAAAFWAGATAFVWYAFGALPLQVSVARQLGLDAASASSWIFIVWTSGAAVSIAAALRWRQPIPITWSIPGLLYLGSLAGQYTLAELVGASLAAGAVLLALGLLGVGGRLMRWLPLPIVLGMFAGSVLPYVTRMVSATAGDFSVAGAVVAGYLAGRWIGSPRVPPVGMAMLCGAAAVAFVGAMPSGAPAWTPPELVLAPMAFSPAAIVAVGFPLVVLAIGLGNVQGLGFLAAQGYRVPVNAVSVLVGAASVVNALFGGHPATVARNGAAILGSSEAGAPGERYAAVEVSALFTLVIAAAAAPLAWLLAALPASYVFALAGVAIISALQDALEKSFGGNLRFGALAAFVVAATPFSALGMGSALWALAAGLAASAVAERAQLVQAWRTA